MRFASILVLAAVMALSGCMTAEQIRAADEAKCRSYGFKAGDGFATCLQHIDLARQREFRRDADEFFDWNRPKRHRHYQ